MASDDRESNESRRDSIGQPESMRNVEQRIRDNQGGSELTDRPESRPAGVPGETASAEAEGPPPDRERGIAAPVRSMGPAETTLPEASPLEGEREQNVTPFDDEGGE